MNLVASVRRNLSAREMIRPGDTVICAVSGGADSVALLELMSRMRSRHGFDAVVLHVDHGLRSDSAEDARFVEDLAARHGLPFYALRTRVRRRRGESMEMAARRVRLAFFALMSKRLKLDAIATGRLMIAHMVSASMRP